MTAKDASTAQAAETAVFAEVARLQQVLSSWAADAEFAQLQQKGEGEPSDDLRAVLGLAERWQASSHGAFQPSIARITRLWEQCAAQQREPNPAELASLVRDLPQQPWTRNGRHYTLAGPVSLDALAKGYIVDRAAQALTAVAGAALVSFQIGGETCVGATPTLIALADPRHAASNAAPLCTVRVAHRAIASSGSYARGHDVGGVHHSHILDPRTGRPCDGVIGASVIAADAATADVAATVLCVLGPTDGFAWLSTIPDAHAVIVTAAGTVHESPGFAQFVAPSQAAAPTAADADAKKQWPKGFALQVDFEIQAPAAGARGRGGWKRPYVAVWVEDITGTPARTLCLWIENRRWLRDLRRWSRQNAAMPDLPNVVSQATRKAGAYTLTWDGKDDEGRTLAPGSYFVCIEVAREHGTYQLIRRQIELAQEPQSIPLEGNVEIARAQLTFGEPAATRKPAAEAK